jgi:hypothetical protein
VTKPPLPERLKQCLREPGENGRRFEPDPHDRRELLIDRPGRVLRAARAVAEIDERVLDQRAQGLLWVAEKLFIEVVPDRGMTLIVSKSLGPRPPCTKPSVRVRHRSLHGAFGPMA